MICYVALLVFPFQILVWLLFNLRLFFRRLPNHVSSSGSVDRHTRLSRKESTIFSLLA